VPFVFTLCGGHISPILVESKKAGMRIIDVRHEVNAVFAADAVGRLTGIPGVAAVTAGPGVTNALTALQNCRMAQSPLVLLGGATATVLRGRGSLQDIDQSSVIRPHVKWQARPNTLRQVVPALEEAFYQARSGVPGPVFVELAVDLLYDESMIREWYSKKTDQTPRNLGERAVQTYLKLHLANQFAGRERPPFRKPRVPHIPVASARTLADMATALSDAKRPMMLIGSQAMLRPDRVPDLAAAVEGMGIPVFLSGMARGLLGDRSAVQFRHKRRQALKQADVVLLAGVSSDFRLDYGGHIGSSQLLSVNLSKNDLNKNRKPDIGTVSDPCDTLIELAERVVVSDRAEWLAALGTREDARDQEVSAMAQTDAPPVNPIAVCQSIERHLSDDSILVVDGGDFVATASYVTRPRSPLSWLDPGVFGTLGVGAGFALGAKLVRPDADVWVLYGDGSVGFSIAEFDTFVRHGVNVLAVVGNDAGWTQIARDQEVILGDDVGTVLTHADYHKVVQGFGAHGVRLDDPDQIDDVLASALKTTREGQPALVNAIIGKTDFRKGSLSM
jgi:acetolactate synthase-1/2/3 large subunit